MKRISVVIPHFEDAERLRRCLGALAEGPEDARAEAEVVVVDNASSVDLAWVTRDFPFVRLVTETSRGAAAARNRGVAETSAPRIAFLDCDCVPRADWLPRAIALPLLTGREVAGGEVQTFDETPAPRSGAEAFETVFAFDQRSYIEDKGFTVTANMVFDRVLFEAVGPLHDGVSEDVEWCQRARSVGAKISYDPALSVRHPTRRDWPALRKKWLRTTREAYGTAQENRLSWLAKAALMPVSAVLHAPRLATSSDLNTLQERVAGLATLFRLRIARGIWMVKLAAGRDPI